MIFLDNQVADNRNQKIQFTKMHGLGNDYLFINCIDNRNIISEREIPAVARYMCNRNFGVGADGIVLINKSMIADFRMNIYNSDGTEAQMCGNGIRCFAKYVYDNKLIEKSEIDIETLCGIKRAYIRNSRVNSRIQEITIDMGRPMFQKEEIPITISKGEEKDRENGLIKLNLDILEKELEVYCVSMGNPHAVIFCKNVDDMPIKEFGALIEKDKHFPEKTNVEFIQVLGSSSIKMRVWERGVGETFACGTGACAVAIVCNMLGLTSNNVTVYLKGGELKIQIDKLNGSELKLPQRVYMTGIATKVFDGEII